MANATLGNKIILDTAGEVTTDRILIAYVIATAAGSSTTIDLGETVASSKITFKFPADTPTTIYDFSRRPLVFNGIYLQAITSGAQLVLITTRGGG